MLFSLIVRIAPVMFLNLNFRINSAGFVSAGHPSEQGASWQSRHQSASAMAWARSSPLPISLNLSIALTTIPPKFRTTDVLQNLVQPKCLWLRRQEWISENFLIPVKFSLA